MAFGNPWSGPIGISKQPQSSSGGKGFGFKPIKPPSPLRLRPGQGNVRFTSGPVRASHPQQYPSTSPQKLSPQQVKYINAGTSAPPNTPSPYDSTYFVQLAQSQNAANQKIAGFQQAIGNGATNTESAINQLKYNEGLAQTNAENAENALGGFAQGALGHQEGLISHSYQQKIGDAFTKYGQQKSAWEAAIAGVQQGLPLTTIALGLASAWRVANLGLQDPGAPGSPGAPGAPQSLSPQQVKYINAGMKGPAKPVSKPPKLLKITKQPKSKGS